MNNVADLLNLLGERLVERKLLSRSVIHRATKASAERSRYLRRDNVGSFSKVSFQTRVSVTINGIA